MLAPVSNLFLHLYIANDLETLKYTISNFPAHMTLELCRKWLLSVDLDLQLRGKVDLHLNRPVWANRLKCDFRKSVLDVTSWVRLINIFHVMH